jgi:hypothetical protein
VSDRLTNLANRVARRKARGHGSVGEWPTSRDYAPGVDPWEAIPLEARKAEVTTLPDGTVRTSYVGTLDEHLAAPPPEPQAAPVVTEAPKRAAKKAAKPTDENRWASYPMPGHGRA